MNKNNIYRRGLQIIILGMAFLAFLPAEAPAQVKRFETEHFEVFYQSGVNLLGACRRLEIRTPFIAESKKKYVANNALEEELADNIERIFYKVLEVLDMRLYSYKGTIRIYQNNAELKKALRHKFGRDLNYPALYHKEENTIYLSAENLQVGIFAHELAHAIINSYFVIKPPERVQEVLAGFVEYNIRQYEK